MWHFSLLIKADIRPVPGKPSLHGVTGFANILGVFTFVTKQQIYYIICIAGHAVSDMEELTRSITREGGGFDQVFLAKDTPLRTFG